jgi:hypothetical protein
MRVRRRFDAINQSRRAHPSQKMELANRLLSCALDTSRGIYVPLGSHPFLKNRLTEDFSEVPEQIAASVGTPLCLFTNPLLLPSESLGDESLRFVRPKLRATNAGFVVATIEHDPESREQFEEMVEWVAKSGKLKKLDEELRSYKDYEGYCAVFSGHRSIHLHFVFTTKHLIHVPFAASAAERWRSYLQHAASMASLSSIYFDKVKKLSDEILAPPVPADRKMRQYEQFRRTPWGVRRLEKDSEILGLPKGALVPQLVLAERMRAMRSAKGSSRYLVPADLQHAAPYPLTQKQGSHRTQVQDLGAAAISELRALCEAEWGLEFPKPVLLRREGSTWVINFQNHATDQHPSTVARGDHNTLLLCGRGTPEREFVLPGELTAQELGEFMALRFGLTRSSEVLGSVTPNRTPQNYFATLKEQSGRSFKETYERGIKRNFPEYSSWGAADLQQVYREKLRRICSHVRSFKSDAILLSAEGIGKTQALFGLMANEALDTALADPDGFVRFNVFAFRSENQAAQKRAEYERETGCRTFLWRSFWNHYTDACKAVGRGPIRRAEFEEETNVLSVVNQIKHEQPGVFDYLEKARGSLWLAEAGRSLFNSNTMLFTTHATVMSWWEGQVTRSWHHPDFDPSSTREEVQSLRDQALLQDVVFDEPEFDELVWLLTADLHDHLASVNQWDWKRRRPAECRELYNETRRSGAIPVDLSFEAYSGLRSLDLGTLERVQVDFEAQPFGRENSPKSIYRARHNTPFYLGVRRWPFAGSTRITYLTTEAFTTELIAAVYKKLRRRSLSWSWINSRPCIPFMCM